MSFKDFPYLLEPVKMAMFDLNDWLHTKLDKNNIPKLRTPITIFRPLS